MDRRIVAVDHNGEEHQPASRSMGSTGAVNLIVMKYDLLLNQVDQIQVQGREYDRYVEFKDVSIESGHKSRPAVQSGATTQPANPHR
jgi:hypothetical protein